MLKNYGIIQIYYRACFHFNDKVCSFFDWRDNVEYKLLNDQNKKYMRSELNNNLNFEWEDTKLLDEIIKKIDIIYPNSSDPKNYQNDNIYLRKVNELFEKLYNRKISNKEFLKKLKSNLKAILKEYPDLEYNYKYKFE